MDVSGEMHQISTVSNIYLDRDCVLCHELTKITEK